MRFRCSAPERSPFQAGCHASSGSSSTGIRTYRSPRSGISTCTKRRNFGLIWLQRGSRPDQIKEARMMIIMKANATPQQVENVIQRIKTMGLAAHLSQGVEATIIGAIGETHDIPLDEFE